MTGQMDQRNKLAPFLSYASNHSEKSGKRDKVKGQFIFPVTETDVTIYTFFIGKIGRNGGRGGG